MSQALAQTVPAQQGRIWTPSYANEFNAGASDLSGFTYDVGGSGWGNSELEVYTAPAGAPPATPLPNGLGSQTTTPVGINSNNVYVTGGNLNITAIATGTGGGQTYTSGRIKTNNLFTQAYGLFEFRAKMPAGQGLWPAVWMMSRDESYGGWPTSGEIDILETRGQETGLVQGTLHSGANPGAHVTQTKTFQQSGLRPPGFTTTDWHTYSLEWIPGSANVAATFKWYVDGINYYTQQGGWFIPNGVPSTNDDAPFDRNFYFLINLAVGGNYVGAPNLAPGSYTMQMDFLRAYTMELRPTWKNDQSGSWSDTTKWTDSISPNAIDADVLLGSAITQPRTVTLTSPKTIGHLTFDNANRYTIAGTQTLTLNTSGVDSRIDVLSGSHTVAAPLSLMRNTLVSISQQQNTLTVSGSLTSATGTTLSKTGPGTLAVTHIRGGAVVVDAGTMQVMPGGGAAGDSKVQSIAVSTANGAKFDLADHLLIIDYTGETPIDSVRLLLSSAYAGGSWSGPGLTSSSAQSLAGGGPAVNKTALGYAEASSLGLAPALSFDGTSILVQYTYAGDANLDGRVDITDLAQLATNWQTSGLWLQGDFDYSGFVDISDLALLATNWQAGAPAGILLEQALASLGLPTVAVPEPAAISTLLLAGAVARRRRHR